MKNIKINILVSFICLLFTNSLVAQFYENFDSGIPSTWAVFDNGVGTTQSWKLGPSSSLAYGGVGQCVLVLRESITQGETSEDWLVTPQQTVPDNGQLRFWTRQLYSGDGGTIYELRVSTTSQTNLSTFTTIASWTETQLNENSAYNIYEKKLVDVSAYDNQNVYFAFVKVNTQTGTSVSGDGWLVDEVVVAPPASPCLAPTSQSVSLNTISGGVDLGWIDNGDALQWEIEVVPSGTTPTYSGTVVNSSPYNLTGLLNDTDYDYYIRSLCSLGEVSEWIGPVAFNSTNCLSLTGDIKTPSLVTYCINTDIILSFDFTSSNHSAYYIYEWSYILNENTSVTGVSSSVSPSFNFTEVGVYTIRLKLTDPATGCEYNFQRDIIVEDCSACWFTVANHQTIESYFIILIKALASEPPGTITNGYTCTELQNLAPYITVSTPAIYNFSIEGEEIEFSFSDHTGTPDVHIVFFPDIKNIALTNFTSPNVPANFYTEYTSNPFADDGRNYVTNVNFCFESCTLTNPYSNYIEQLFLSLINDIASILQSGGTVDSTYNSMYLQNLAPYIAVSNPGIYNLVYNPSGFIQFSFSSNVSSPGYDVWLWYGSYTGITTTDLDYLDISTFINTDIFLNYVGAEDTNGSGKAKFYIRNVNFCPEEGQVSCTAINPYSSVVNGLLVDLLEHLIQRKLDGDTDSAIEGSTPIELIALAPYITDPNPVGIYNFVSAYTPSNILSGISFSFSQNHSVDISINGSNSHNITDDFQFDLSEYDNTEEGITIDSYTNNDFNIKSGIIKHIEFCPDELLCKAHVAIVVDESGSIDDREAFRIKTQLNSFIRKQASDNEALGANMHISLIGLSDSDDPTSRDSGISSSGNNIIGTEKITSQNVDQYLNWIKDYRRGRVSPSSDYWRGGLEKALSLGDVDLVILITDGCQTNDAEELQRTVRKFNNNGGGADNEYTNTPPHLFVIGIEDGFYVDTDELPSTGKALSNNQDPNYNPELSRQSITGRVTSFLRTSLKYLMEYSGTEFPVEEKYYFNYNNDSPALMVDYYGTDNFGFFTEEVNYLSNGLTGSDVDLSCGGYIPLETCNNCINFKLDGGREYVVSTWVKEEQKKQVYNYDNPKIYINFSDDTGKRILHPSDPANTVDPGDPQYSPWPYYVKGETSGEIIDGWQRIFTKFTVPSNAIYLEVELVNLSQIVPVYFDDIRIHPKNGSMKSFVYDPETFRLMSELDENNYSTFYEYDKEGGLIRVKKETSRGVKTIQETRSGNVIKEDNDE